MLYGQARNWLRSAVARIVECMATSISWNTPLYYLVSAVQSDPLICSMDNLMSSEWYKRIILLAKSIACSFNFHWISWWLYSNEQVVLCAGNVLQTFLERKFAWKRKTVTCDDWNRDMMMFHLCNGDIIPNNIFMYTNTHTVLQSSILLCFCLSLMILIIFRFYGTSS